jgi:hypothetical protein
MSRPVSPILACYTRISRNQCTIPSLPLRPVRPRALYVILNRFEAEAGHNHPEQRLAVWRRIGCHADGQVPARTHADSRRQRYRIETETLTQRHPYRRSP